MNAETSRKPAIRHPVATWDMARYRKAARRLSALSCSVATRAALASVISSHAKRKAMTPSAAKTISTVPTSTLKHTPRKADRRRSAPWAAYPRL